MFTIIDQATKYRGFLGPDGSTCENFNYKEWGAIALKDKSKRICFPKTYTLIAKHNPFDEPGVDEGMAFNKGARYLSALLVESTWNKERVEKAAKTLELLKRMLNTVWEWGSRTNVILKDARDSEILCLVHKKPEICRTIRGTLSGITKEPWKTPKHFA